MTAAGAAGDGLPPPTPLTARQWATYLQYLSVWEAAARLPGPLAWRLPDPLGDLWYRFAPARQRSQVARNQGRVTGLEGDDLDAQVRAAYRSYARYWLDSFRAHRLDPDVVRARTEDVGMHNLDEIRADGNGAVLATAHLGSWEVGAFFSTTRGWRLAVVAEVVDPRPLFDRFVRLRRQLGLEVIPLVRGGDMIPRLQALVEDGATATLLADRDLTGKGPVVRFFGEPCRLPPGPAVLARRTGRPVAVGAFFATPRGWRAVIRDVLDISRHDIEAGTQAIAEALERLILEAPEQWHVFVPNWVADRAERERSRAVSRGR